MIITCPRCSKNHKVNPDSLKPFADAGKKTIMASCKSCKFKFPVTLSSLLTSEEKSGDRKRKLGSVARKICITLSKGGVGKTATAVNLSYLAAEEGKNTLLCDLDPQSSSTYYFRIKPKKASRSRR